MQKVTIYFAQGVHRSTIVANAMLKGSKKFTNFDVSMKPSRAFKGRMDSDVAIFYGLSDGLREIFDAYRTRRRVIFIDLGYFGRRKSSRYDGHHKLVLNSRHPTAYFQDRQHSPDRFRSFGIEIKPWREDGRHILVVGMSAKAARAEGLVPESWERETIARLKRITNRPIIYRPKPNWDGARPIPGADFRKEQTLEHAFADCHCIVSHHSNVAVDALLAGIPSICFDGVASKLSGHDLTQIESPPMPDGREQWAADLAWTQFSVEEMENGTAFKYLIGEGLI